MMFLFFPISLKTGKNYLGVASATGTCFQYAKPSILLTYLHTRASILLGKITGYRHINEFLSRK